MNLTYYPKNRQLYHNRDKPVTLHEVYFYIKQGGTIKVKCHKTKADITDIILRKCLKFKTSLYADDLYEFLRK